jgi:DNA-directed RNA polymerase subunit RPC12/RpoP
MNKVKFEDVKCTTCNETYSFPVIEEVSKQKDWECADCMFDHLMGEHA